MATREENMKKINDELEKMSDDELDQVTGGTAKQTADDSCFLNSLNGSTDRYGTANVFFSSLFSNYKENEVKNAWAKLGITLKFHHINSNKYYLGDKEISQEEARQHAMKVTGHHMERKDWYW